MTNDIFKGVLIEKDDNGYRAEVKDIRSDSLPDGDVAIDVSYSTINYKDALAITGKGPVVRKFPMIPGIDLVGTVTRSDTDKFSVGQQVILNGWGVGEAHWGGLAEKAVLNSDWLIPLPDNLSPMQAMTIGTAGYTAMLSVITLERYGLSPDSGSILVTGANGGVGSFSISILSQLGYHVVASTGRMEEADYLKKLGAQEIIDRATLSESGGRPLAKEQWAGAIDSAGSHTLANVCAAMKYNGVVAACGLAQGMDFTATVAPFILRGVTLAGIDSVMRPIDQRIEAWQRLATINHEHFDDISTVIGLNEVFDNASALLEGKIRGRLVVDVNQ